MVNNNKRDISLPEDEDLDFLSDHCWLSRVSVHENIHDRYFFNAYSLYWDYTTLAWVGLDSILQICATLSQRMQQLSLLVSVQEVSALAFGTTKDTDYIVGAEISTRPWLYNDADSIRVFPSPLLQDFSQRI